ncbi:hypothetical protein J6590_007992 [Homalodisca vitripennis]|nr:hypothetical protein J6590_007992 [Homalodisca vitripennis]
MNPQFHIQIPRTSSNKCHVVVSVTQYYETQPETKKKKPLYAIGFAVYEIPHSMPRLTPQFVIDQKPLDVTNHSIAREVVTFFTLPPGDYIVVPQTNVPNCDGKFLLRILTDEQSNIWEVNEDNMVFRNISAEFLEDAVVLPDGKNLIGKLLIKYPPEVDVSQLQKILKAHWKAYLLEKPSLELCKSLIMLRDYNISGRINVLDIPVLMHMLQFWRIAFEKFDRGSHSSKTSSYNLRALLWEAGSTVSNKVLECLVLRFAKNCTVSAECFVMAMVRLHLAHADQVATQVTCSMQVGHFISKHVLTDQKAMSECLPYFGATTWMTTLKNYHTVLLLFKISNYFLTPLGMENLVGGVVLPVVCCVIFGVWYA